MMTIAYKRLGSSSRGLVMWQIACLALIRVVWRERSVRIFEDKVRTVEVSLGYHSFPCFLLGLLRHNF